MNEQLLKQILDKLSHIEQRLNVIEDEHTAQDRDGGRLSDCAKRFGSPPTQEQFEILSKVNIDPSFGDSVSKGGCLFDNVKPGTPTGISCPCPKCSPYSATTYSGNTTSRFLSSEIKDLTFSGPSWAVRELQRPTFNEEE